MNKKIVATSLINLGSAAGDRTIEFGPLGALIRFVDRLVPKLATATIPALSDWYRIAKNMVQIASFCHSTPRMQRSLALATLGIWCRNAAFFSQSPPFSLLFSALNPFDLYPGNRPLNLSGVGYYRGTGSQSFHLLRDLLTAGHMEFGLDSGRLVSVLRGHKHFAGDVTPTETGLVLPPSRRAITQPPATLDALATPLTALPMWEFFMAQTVVLPSTPDPVASFRQAANKLAALSKICTGAPQDDPNVSQYCLFSIQLEDLVFYRSMFLRGQALAKHTRDPSIAAIQRAQMAHGTRLGLKQVQTNLFETIVRTQALQPNWAVPPKTNEVAATSPIEKRSFDTLNRLHDQCASPTLPGSIVRAALRGLTIEMETSPTFCSAELSALIQATQPQITEYVSLLNTTQSHVDRCTQKDQIFETLLYPALQLMTEPAGEAKARFDEQLKQVLPKIGGHAPAMIHSTTSAMSALSNIMGCFKGHVGGHTALPDNLYYEIVDVIKETSQHYQILDADRPTLAPDTELVVIEPYANCATQTNIFTVSINQMLDLIANRKSQRPAILLIDITSTHFTRPETQAMIANACATVGTTKIQLADLINQGLVFPIFFQSLGKYSSAGTNKLDGGLFWHYGQPPKKFTAFAEALDPLPVQMEAAAHTHYRFLFTHLNNEIVQLLDTSTAAATRIYKLTQQSHFGTATPLGLSVSRRVSGPDVGWISIQTGQFATSMFTDPKTMIRTDASLITTTLAVIKALTMACQDFPEALCIEQQGFGYLTTNLGNCATAVRLTPGAMSDEGIRHMASAINRIVANSSTAGQIVLDNANKLAALQAIFKTKSDEIGEKIKVAKNKKARNEEALLSATKELATLTADSKSDKERLKFSTMALALSLLSKAD